MTEEVPMPQSTRILTAEQWAERLYAWAVERWGEARAQAIREEIEATATHLALIAEYPLAMEQTPAFFMTEG
jgi:hypothetical protein